MNGWIGVDLDGTLAFYDEWRGAEHIGDPVPAMLLRVRQWLDRGLDVRIFTARVSNGDKQNSAGAIKRWCLEHLGQELPVTCEKDYGMIELWDDRCVQVEQNTGRLLGKSSRGLF
jgi:hypothetical protein